MQCLDENAVLALLSGSHSDAAAARAHLAECDACRELVAEAARSTTREEGPAFAATEIAWGSSHPQSDLADPSLVEPGSLLDGRYRVERVLGSGGMGVVALATHTQLDQQLAIKLLHPRAVGSPEVVARFMREARAAARVRSEHVVKVHDVASLPSGEPYIAMEYLIGRDARAMLDDQKKLPTQVVADLVAQACLGVGEAHRAGIVHRDLKPANLFVIDTKTREPSFVVKVLDFGVSKMQRDEITSDEVSLTRSTSLIGTPLYMSPEQVKAAKDVDARTDVWALGCIMLELSTGESPFRRGSLGETCAAILIDEPDLRAVPRELREIVARCLNKDRNARYADALALAAALASLVGEETRREIESVVQVVTEKPKRRVWPLAALAIVGAVAFMLTRKSPPPSAIIPTEHAIAPSPSVSVVAPIPSPTPVVSAAPVASPRPIVIKTPVVSPQPSPSPSIVIPVTPSASVSSKPLNPEFGDRL